MTKKRILSMLLCLCMAVSLLPTFALAAEDAVDIRIDAEEDLDSTTNNETYQKLDAVADVTVAGDIYTITLTQDFVGRFFIDTAVRIIIDAAGHTVDGGSLGEALCLENGANTNVTLKGNGTFVEGTNNAAYIGTTAVLNIESATFIGRFWDYSGSGVATTSKVVTYKDDGTSYAVQYVPEGGNASAPIPAPAKEGCELLGWCAENSSEPFDFVNTTVTEDMTLHASWVEEGEIPTVEFGGRTYITDANGVMAYYLGTDMFDIIGKYDGNWKKTTYSSGGFKTYLKVGDTTQCVKPAGTTVDGVTASIHVAFTNEGKTLKINYVVDNPDGKTFSIGTGADIQIGSDDSAAITLLENGGGFKMVSDYSSDKNASDEYAQFNFFGKGYTGVTDVSDFWYGKYGTWSGNKSAVAFYGMEQSLESDTSYDSAASWHWANEVATSETYSVQIGIGGAGSEVIETFEVGGTVTDSVDTPIDNATVKLVKNGNVIALDDTEAGVFNFENIAPGTYNLVVTQGELIVTQMVTVANENYSGTIVLPTGDNKNSAVDNSAAGAFAATVGGLDEIAVRGYDYDADRDDYYSYYHSELEVVDVKLFVTAEAESDAEKNAIKAEVEKEGAPEGRELKIDFFGLTLEKTVDDVEVDDIGENNPQLLTIMIPFSTAGKQEIAVYRYHGGVAAKLNENPGSDEEGFTVGGGYVTIYAKNFSTYAIAYTVAAPEGGSGGDIDDDKPDEQPPVSSPAAPHRCTSQCPICGGCTDVACPFAACGKKCTGISVNYSDVASSAWYSDEVEYVCHLGLMEGYGNGIFNPDGTVTRQQMWMVLARMSGATPANMAAARSWAMAMGISDGSNPGAAVTRQQFITMLYRYAVLKGYDVSVGEDTNILSYTDAFDIADYAISAMQWGCGAGIIGGYNDGSLKPMNGSSRAHMAAFLMRFCVNTVKD